MARHNSSLKIITVISDGAIGRWSCHNGAELALARAIGQIMPHFLLVCRDPSRPVGVVIMEAPSMLQAYTNAVARGVAAGMPFGEAHELSAKMMTSVPQTQIGRMMSGAEAAQMIVRLVEGRARPEEMTGRFPRPWRVVEHPASFSVQDATGQRMAWFHFRNDPGITQPAAMLFKDEARRRAMNFVGLPEPLSEAVGPPAADWVARRN